MSHVPVQEYAVLAESNEGLQQRARQVLDLRNKGRPVVTGGLSQLEGADTRYRCGATILYMPAPESITGAVVAQLYRQNSAQQCLTPVIVRAT
jgi:hypothetical protein